MYCFLLRNIHNIMLLLALSEHFLITLLVPALMKMNVSCLSMPVGISAKGTEDNVLPREMVSSAINLDN